jgi:hypothetical protein
MAKCIRNLTKTIRLFSPLSIILISTVLPIPKYPATLTFIQEINSCVDRLFKTAGLTIALNTFSSFVSNGQVNVSHFDSWGIHLASANVLSRRYRQGLSKYFVDDKLLKQYNVKVKRKVHDAISNKPSFLSVKKSTNYPYIFQE